MYQIIQHKEGKLKGKYEAVLFEKGRLINSTNVQGYNRKKQAIASIYLATLKQIFGADNYYSYLYVYFQDNTLPTPKIFKYFRTKVIEETKLKPVKPYIPASRKKK